MFYRLSLLLRWWQVHPPEVVRGVSFPQALQLMSLATERGLPLVVRRLDDPLNYYGT